VWALCSRAAAGQRQDQSGHSQQGSRGHWDYTEEGRAVGSQTPGTEWPRVLPQRAAARGAVLWPPRSACAEQIFKQSQTLPEGNDSFSSPGWKSGGTRQLPCTPFPSVPQVISSFLSKTKAKSRYERWVATSCRTVHAAFAELRCQFPHCRQGLKVLQVPWHPGT